MDGNYHRQIRGGGGMMGGGNLHAAQGIAVDDTRVYIADSYHSAVAVYGKNGIFLGYVGEYGENAGEMRIPLDIAFDRDGKLFVANNNNSRIEVIGIDSYTSLYLDPSIVNITVFENSAPFVQLVNISSDQNATWTAVENSTWLWLGSGGGTTPGQLALNVNPAGLGVGTYSTIVTVTSGTGTEYAVAVNLSVIPLPKELSAAPSGIELTLQKNAMSLPDADITLTSLNGSVTWTGASDKDWLSLDRSSGSTPDSIKAVITSNANTLAEGMYTGKITIDAGAGVIGSPATVDVTLRVIVAGTLKVITNNPDALFTITGPVDLSGSGTEWVNNEIAPGTYMISFDHIPGFEIPAPQTFSIETGRETVIEAVYEVKRPATHIVAASASSNGKKVVVLTLDGSEIASFVPFVSAENLIVSTGDVNGDGLDEIVVSDTHKMIKIFTFDGEQLGGKKLPFWYGQQGMTVGDIDNDGIDEVIVSILEARGLVSARNSAVKVFEFMDGGLEEVGTIYEVHDNFAMKIAVGDLDGDGSKDLVTSDSRMIRKIDIRTGTIIDLADTLGYDGIPEIATGDLNDDGLDEVIIGASLGNGTPQPVDDTSVIKVAGFDSVYEPFFDLGARKTPFLAVADIDGDNEDEIAVGTGVGEPGQALIRLLESDMSFGGISFTPDIEGSGVSIAFGVFE